MLGGGMAVMLWVKLVQRDIENDRTGGEGESEER